MFPDGVAHRLLVEQIRVVDPAAEHAHGDPSSGERSLVRRGVNPLCPAAHNNRAGPAEAAADLERSLPTGRARMAGPDDGDGGAR